MLTSAGRTLFAGLLLSALVATPVRAQEVRSGGRDTITIRGFVNGSLFVQDALFNPGNGQRSGYVARELDDWWHGGDVRNTRISLRFATPPLIRAWRVDATAEMDFFGTFAANTPFGPDQPQPRLRVAAVELKTARTGVKIGQDWSLLYGVVPVSTSHLAYQIGWGTGGSIGWRFPGVWFSQELARPGARTSTTLRLAVLKNSWTGSTDPELPNDGNAGLPQFEGRLDFRRKQKHGGWNAYLAGHVDSKNLNGVRPEGAPELPSHHLTGWATEGGGRFDAGRLSLLGNAYIGRAMAQQASGLFQFGDIRSWGAWGQIGLRFAPHWSLWGVAGTENPRDEDVLDAVAATDPARLKSWVTAPMLRFDTGPYELGLEWLHSRTTTAAPLIEAGLPRAESVLNGNQVLFSVLFRF